MLNYQRVTFFNSSVVHNLAELQVGVSGFGYGGTNSHALAFGHNAPWHCGQLPFNIFNGAHTLWQFNIAMENHNF